MKRSEALAEIRHRQRNPLLHKLERESAKAARETMLGTMVRLGTIKPARKRVRA